MEKELKKTVALSIFIGLLILVFFLVKPFISAILFAAVLAYILYPIHKRVLKLIKNKNVSAGLITFIFIVALAVILWFMAQIAIKEAFNLYLSIQEMDVFNSMNSFLSKFFIDSPELSRQLTLSIEQIITQAINSFMDQAGKIITNAPALFLQIFVAFFVAFYFLRDGDKIVKFVSESLPFKEQVRKRFVKRSDEIAKATVFGQVIVGIVQGATTGIGLYLFGAPSPLFFSILAIFLAILPFIGPSFIWVPVSLVMLLGGNINGLYLFIYGIVIVSWIDNVVRPYIVGKKGKLNPIIALIGMLGGLVLLGPIGLVVGPLVLEYLLIFIRLYKEGELNS